MEIKISIFMRTHISQGFMDRPSQGSTDRPESVLDFKNFSRSWSSPRFQIHVFSKTLGVQPLTDSVRDQPVPSVDP